MESRHKILVGTVALIARVLTLMAYNVISRHNSLQMNGPNVTIPCLFETWSTEGVLNKSFNSKWITVPDFLFLTSLTMLYIGVIELISAQVPFFMKGLVIYYLLLVLCILDQCFVAGCISTIRPHSLHLGNRNSQLWILVHTAINNSWFGYIFNPSHTHKVVQKKTATRCITKRTLFCWKILQ